MLKAKDKNTKHATDMQDADTQDADTEVVCGAPTPALARHTPNEETLQAIRDVAKGRNLYEYESYEELKRDILGD